MLKTLKRIVQEVTTTTDLSESVNILVQRVREATPADAVSVYLLDMRRHEYVLVATDGHPPEAVFRLRIADNSGLIGQVGRREEPINVDNAPLHPAFCHHPALNEKEFHGFLGVPIIQHRRHYGVLCLQQHDARCFDDQEEAFLITLATQMGGMLAHAEATGELAELTRVRDGRQKPQKHKIHDTKTLHGIACVAGVALGQPVLIYPKADLDSVPKTPSGDIDEEIASLFQALADVRADIFRLSEKMKPLVAEEEHALFDVYARVLDDDTLGQEIADTIRSEKLGAQAALATVIKRHVQQFEAMEDDYLRERAADFRDLGTRVLARLQMTQQHEHIYPAETILVGEELTASDLAEVPEGQLKALVSARGGPNAHVAILARSLGVPTVMGVRGFEAELFEGKKILVDGYLAEVVINPSPDILKQFKRWQEQEARLNQLLTGIRDKPAQTLDEHRVSLQVNAGLAMEAGLSLSVGADGVGLFRTEVPFMTRDRFPSEDEQYIIYRQMLKAFAPRPVTMRTLDLGGDKALPYFPVEEENPYLGWRGIRVTLDHPDVFLMQVRAMIRASEGLNNLKIMLPMVTTLGEADEAFALIEQAYREIEEEGVPVIFPKLGVMIEVPAAIHLTGDFARRVNFVSVGTNDLTQYLLAVDRNNSRVANLYDMFHPALIQSLVSIVDAAHAEGVEVSICGEMASDPLAAVLLIAMGFDTLSMNSNSLPKIKWLIRHISLTNARKMLSEVLKMNRSETIRVYLHEMLVAEGFGHLIRAQKT